MYVYVYTCAKVHLHGQMHAERRIQVTVKIYARMYVSWWIYMYERSSICYRADECRKMGTCAMIQVTVYMYARMHKFIYVCRCMQKDVFQVCVRVHVCMCVCIWVYMYERSPTWADACRKMCGCAVIQVCVRVHVCMCVCIAQRTRRTSVARGSCRFFAWL